MTHLERHRRAILGAVLAIWLGVVAALFWQAPVACGSGGALFGVATPLLPYLALALVAANSVVRALTSRALGQALDRRPFHFAIASGALALFTLLAVSRHTFAVAAPASALALALVSLAIREWVALLRLLGSESHLESPHVDDRAPAVLGGVGGSVTLFEARPEGYRQDAKGVPVAVVPKDRRRAQQLVRRHILIACNVAVVGALVAGALAVTQRGSRVAVVTPSTWRGDIDLGGHKEPFTLRIDEARWGQMRGTMEWTNTTANVEGTYEGRTLVFYDTSIARSNGTPFVLNDRKDVRIEGDVMTGTDKAGAAPLHAVRVR